MSKPSEQKSVQARIFKYAGEIGWTIVSQSEAESSRGFDTSAESEKELRELRQAIYFALFS